MEKIKFYLEKYKIIWIILSLIILSLFLFIIFNKEDKVEASVVLEEIEEEKEEKIEELNDIKTIKVDVKGEVKKPGVYELYSDSRVIDAIDTAGGFSKNANTKYINLSKKLTDEMVIIVYSNKEITEYEKKEDNTIYIEYECDCPDSINDACINEKEEKNIIEEKDSLININKATIDELTKLDGIGESKAKSIIKYREENGEFKNIEDIKNVSGIGDSAYSKIKDNIKI